jgi:hypothetical protein
MKMKTHLAQGLYSMPACGRAMRPGNYSTAHCVEVREFKIQPENEVCSYCAKLFLRRRNQQRRQKGLQPVTKWNEGFAR